MKESKLRKEIQRIENNYNLLSDTGTYGTVYLDKDNKVVYKVGNISRVEFDNLLKLSKLGLCPRPLTIMGKKDVKILKMEYIEGLTWLKYLEGNSEMTIEEIDKISEGLSYEDCMKIINLHRVMHCELKVSHNDLHEDNIIVDSKTGELKLIDLAAMGHGNKRDINYEFGELCYEGLFLPDAIGKKAAELSEEIRDNGYHYDGKQFYPKLNEAYDHLIKFTQAFYEKK